jgi:hypothetical protein
VINKMETTPSCVQFYLENVLRSRVDRQEPCPSLDEVIQRSYNPASGNCQKAFQFAATLLHTVTTDFTPAAPQSVRRFNSSHGAVVLISGLASIRYYLSTIGIMSSSKQRPSVLVRSLRFIPLGPTKSNSAHR